MFTFEGNIGAGKSTLLSMLERDISDSGRFVMDQEPVNAWEQTQKAEKDGEGQNLLRSFYENPRQYAYLFQMYVLQTRSKQLMDKIKKETGKTIISERSIFSDAEIFAKNGFKNGTIDPHEMFVYKEWHKMMQDIICPNVQGMIYIRVSPEVCFARIQKRARRGEENITLDYLKQLHQRHDEWLLGEDGPRVPKLVLDFDDENNERALRLIKMFLKI